MALKMVGIEVVFLLELDREFCGGPNCTVGNDSPALDRTIGSLHLWSSGNGCAQVSAASA